MPAGNYTVTDYLDIYGSIMQFNKNKNTYIHGWYPFVEGYSKEFIHSIVNEYQNRFNKKPNNCLEPFAGSGTTPLELQKLGINCSAFEVSPFMYNLSTTKLYTGYTVNTFKHFYELISHHLENYIINIENHIKPPQSRTIVKKEGLKKWNFNSEVMKGILDIKYAINNINNKYYKNLFTIALASILLDVSNVYRNGKCVSYKKDWENNINYTRTDIHRIYLQKLDDVFYPDIVKINRYKRKYGRLYSNYANCYYGDVRKNLPQKIADNTIDLVITSPPYLNSRDYTDTYMVELRMLDYIKDYPELQKLRTNTLRSHVQVKWENVQPPQNLLLSNTIKEISKFEDKFWNESIPDMINGYFEDLNTLFKSLSKKIIDKGMIYFNVANSAYYGIEVKTDEIVAQIAEQNGFYIEEIREARRISPSSQQKDSIPYLRESVIVMQKRA